MISGALQLSLWCGLEEGGWGGVVGVCVGGG